MNHAGTDRSGPAGVAAQGQTGPAAARRELRVAVVQTRDAPPDVAANLAHGLARLQEAADAGAHLCVFPELFLSGYYLDRAMAGRARAAEAALARLQAAVDVAGVEAVVGLPLLDPGDRLLNATAVLRPGRDPEMYAKTHLFRGERDWFAPGPALWTGTIAGWVCGLAVCYEIGFPEIARSCALAGARLLLAPAAFGRARERIWGTATVARALENNLYVVAAGQAGTNGALQFAGRSRVVDPTGVVTAEAGDDDELLVADLDADLVDEVRDGRHDQANAYLKDRRPGLYRCE